MRPSLVLVVLSSALAGAEECFTQSWDACKCESFACDNSDKCLGPCDAKQESVECRSLSSKCGQYDNLLCGSWCTDQRGENITCASCRSEECEPFCHGDPSVCKFDMCPVNAATCGDSWAFACLDTISPADTKKALGDASLGVFTSASIAAALTAFNDKLKAEGTDCDCSIYNKGEHVDPFCKKTDLCSAVQGILDDDASPREDAAWDGRCCAYCMMVDDLGECGLWSPTGHYGNMINRLAPLLAKMEEL